MNVKMMKRTGKIARLPRPLRDQLNQRLYHGEPGVELVQWLNALPEVQALLAEHFAGVPISPQNLSEWNHGGFLDWLTTQELLEDAREFAAHAAELPGADGELAGSLSHAIIARYAVLLGKIPLDGPIPPDVLAQINLLLRLHRMALQVQRRALLAQKERLTMTATPPSQKGGCDASSQKGGCDASSQRVPATPPSPHHPANPTPAPESAPLTRKQNAQMNRWLNQIELQPAILPPLATNRHPKNFPALAGFYEKP